MAGQHLIVGTAGHIDHGKTSLVRALTGVNLDSLPEEQERGITIALGFTHLELPDGRRAAFVDVPGHEKLVRTMIAGATGLDGVILVIAANEGVMPQTREHLAILSLLGVTKGFVALTKCDLVDEETRDFAVLDIEETVTGTFLEGAPITFTAVGESPQGLDEVRNLLSAWVDEAASAEEQQAPFRLPIDRAFIQRGFGTVVTGTARGRPLSDGSPVWVQPLGLSSRVRGLQVHGSAVQTAEAGQRVAVNLAGIERDDLARGMVVVSDPEIQAASMLDVEMNMLDGVATIQSGGHVRLSLGTAEVLAVADVIGGAELTPGTRQLVQLRTEMPILALPGDHFIVRRESPLETLGGGTVLDPWATRAKRKHHGTIAAELNRLAAGETDVLLDRAGPSGLSIPQASLRNASGGVTLGDRILHGNQVERLTEHLQTMLAHWHAENPLSAGAPRRAMHTGLAAALTERAYDSLIHHGCEAGIIAQTGPTIRLSEFSIQLTDAQATARDAMITQLHSAGLEGELFSALIQQTRGMLQLLLDEEVAERVGDRVVHTELLSQLKSDISSFFAQNPRLSPSDFKSLTVQSRRTAIPLLEWLDSAGITRRDGDARVPS